MPLLCTSPARPSRFFSPKTPESFASLMIRERHFRPLRVSERLAVATAVVVFLAPAARPQAMLSVDPWDISSSQFPDSTTTQILTLANVGDAGLNFTIRESENDCSTYTNLPWVSVSRSTGSIPLDGEITVAVVFNSYGLTRRLHGCALHRESRSRDARGSRRVVVSGG